MKTLTRRTPELKEVERNSRLQARRDSPYPANSKRAKVNIVDSVAFGIAFGWIVWIPVAAIAAVFSGSAPTVVAAGGISLIDHLPVVHDTRQPSARWTEPEDALEALFGRTER